MKTMLLQQITWYNLLFIVLGSGTGGGLIVLFLLKWWRFKPMDDANVEEKKAQIKKLGAETDVTIVAEAMKLVSMLRGQLEDYVKYHEELQEELDLQRKRNEEAQRRLDHLQETLNAEKEMCRQMAIEMEQLKVQLARYERGRNPN